MRYEIGTPFATCSELVNQLGAFNLNGSCADIECEKTVAIKISYLAILRLLLILASSEKAVHYTTTVQFRNSPPQLGVHTSFIHRLTRDFGEHSQQKIRYRSHEKNKYKYKHHKIFY